jgi:hypothetical protein
VMHWCLNCEASLGVGWTVWVRTEPSALGFGLEAWASGGIQSK